MTFKDPFQPKLFYDSMIPLAFMLKWPRMPLTPRSPSTVLCFQTVPWDVVSEGLCWPQCSAGAAGSLLSGTLSRRVPCAEHRLFPLSYGRSSRHMALGPASSQGSDAFCNGGIACSACQGVGTVGILGGDGICCTLLLLVRVSPFSCT